jgi:hypothetical protein
MSSDRPRAPSSPRATVGFRTHSGWAAFVALSLEQNGPRVLARGRPELVETFTYEFRQPYHTAEKLSLDNAQAFVFKVESDAKSLALSRIRSLQADLRQQGYDLTQFALILASAKPLPSLDRILASHALIHTADGELFRGALAYAGEKCNLARCTVKEGELVDSACKTLGLQSKNLMAQLTALGKAVGSPWSQDEKFAALAAWLALSTSGAGQKLSSS